MAQRETLLTGFGAFGSVVSNPTERLVRYFEGREVPGHALTTCVLPVSYRRAPEILTEALRRGGRDGRPFECVWMLGVAAGSPHWRVEKYGHNRNGAAPDCDAFTPWPEIASVGPSPLEVTAPVEALVTALEHAGLPAAISESAGDYLCNHALYIALLHLKERAAPTCVGFLHVPSDEHTLKNGDPPGPHYEFARHIQAVEATLAVLKNQP